MSRWFRFYDDVINDPKVLTLPEAMRWAWVAILCIASKHEGKLPHVDHIALMLRTNKQRAAATLAGLHNAGLLDKTEAGFEPHNWNGRQYKSDVSTERVKRFRNGQRNAERNVSETPPEAEDREQIQIDDADERKRAFELTEKLLAIAGHDPGFWPPGWMGAPMRVQTWRSRGWPDGVIESAVKAVCARKPPRSIGNVQYFEAAIAEEFARQSAPLPVVEIRQAEKLTVTHGKPKSAIIQAADDLCQRIASFDGPARVADELRSGEGETPPRLLSHG